MTLEENQSAPNSKNQLVMERQPQLTDSSARNQKIRGTNSGHKPGRDAPGAAAGSPGWEAPKPRSLSPHWLTSEPVLVGRSSTWRGAHTWRSLLRLLQRHHHEEREDDGCRCQARAQRVTRHKAPNIGNKKEIRNFRSSSEQQLCGTNSSPLVEWGGSLTQRHPAAKQGACRRSEAMQKA